MSQKVAYSCDVCLVEKKEVNHWLVSEESKVGIDFHTWGWAEREGKLEPDGPNIIRHLCGQACCHRVLDDFLSRQREKWNPSDPTANTAALSYNEEVSG
jgi:hypothetical protein